MNSEGQNKAAVEEHWQASESGDSRVEHAIYSTGRDPRLSAVR